MSMISKIAAKAERQGGVQMDMRAVPILNIVPNPINREIYVVGDLDALRDDIKANGLRTPLEVTPAADGKYTIIGGERRWTACMALYATGDKRFERLPCNVREHLTGDEGTLALITSNATARELTDGERLAQYETVKDILTRRKAAGQLEGRVADEVCRMLGISGGARGRLNYIAEHGGPDVRAALKDGKISMSKAYEASKLYTCQQKEYLERGYACPPPYFDAETRREFMAALVQVRMADVFADYDFGSMGWGRFRDRKPDYRLDEDGQLPDGTKIHVEYNPETGCIIMTEPDPADANNVLHVSRIDEWEYTQAAKAHYYQEPAKPEPKKAPAGQKEPRPDPEEEARAERERKLKLYNAEAAAMCKADRLIEAGWDRCLQQPGHGLSMYHRNWYGYELVLLVDNNSRVCNRWVLLENGGETVSWTSLPGDGRFYSTIGFIVSNKLAEIRLQHEEGK